MAPSILLHPLVPIDILNSFTANYNPAVELSVGILLGTKKENTYEITSSFHFIPQFDPSPETSEKKLQKLLGMHRLVYKDDHCLGWFKHHYFFTLSQFYPQLAVHYLINYCRYICGSFPPLTEFSRFATFFQQVATQQCLCLSVSLNSKTEQIDSIV